MRHGSTNRRQRSRGKGGNTGRRENQSRTQVFDSNGPDVRIRGTAYQVVEKYLALSKDAKSIDNSVLAESYLQHAEHYQRIINSWVKQDDDEKKASEERINKKNSEVDGNFNKDTANESVSKEISGEDDLSLPASILGLSPDVKKEKRTQERTAEMAE